MKERPILFSGAMVCALIDGTKTQTRRQVKITHRTPGLAMCLEPTVGEPRPHAAAELCPYGQPGDRLWVRETWTHPLHHSHPVALYRATDERAASAHPKFERWIPSIHMPRWASRITLEITGIRVERLNDCSEQDAIAEGVPVNASAIGVWTSAAETELLAIAAYRRLWESINGAGSWSANPWVWVLEFRLLASPQKTINS